ncbi:hypothetical protein Cgig2_026422 [Carnegiea gigantea]|uniref:Uncharacterized protein n=1 Tax=Carnegiea gigantea TaxID=171969 RepID=A0A9Q1JJX4_9CARY|nr:hypothetical protein Cgig2_026422 [Carnegiea gigantea]
MADSDERMQAKDATNSKNLMNDNMARKSGVTLAYKRKSRHRMAPGGFLTLVERLEYEQWSAIVEAQFGGILSVRTKLIPKSLAKWLLEKYDPWNYSLNLANGKLLIDEEDVYATLGFLMGEFEVIEGQTSDADTELLDLGEEDGMLKEVDPQLGAWMK